MPVVEPIVDPSILTQLGRLTVSYNMPLGPDLKNKKLRAELGLTVVAIDGWLGITGAAAACLARQSKQMERSDRVSRSSAAEHSERSRGA